MDYGGTWTWRGAVDVFAEDWGEEGACGEASVWGEAGSDSDLQRSEPSGWA